MAALATLAVDDAAGIAVEGHLVGGLEVDVFHNVDFAFEGQEGPVDQLFAKKVLAFLFPELLLSLDTPSDAAGFDSVITSAKLRPSPE